MKQSIIKRLRAAGLNPKEFDTDASKSLLGREVAYAQGTPETVRTALVTGGFGAEPEQHGTALFVRSPETGRSFRIDRSEVIAAKKVKP